VLSDLDEVRLADAEWHANTRDSHSQKASADRSDKITVLMRRDCIPRTAY